MSTSKSDQLLVNVAESIGSTLGTLAAKADAAQQIFRPKPAKKSRSKKRRKPVARKAKAVVRKAKTVARKVARRASAAKSKAKRRK